MAASASEDEIWISPMQLYIQGEMDIEVDGEPVHLEARADGLLLTLRRLTTLAAVARVLSQLPRTIHTKVSLSHLTVICPSIVIKIGEDTVLQVSRRDGFLSSVWPHQFTLSNKKIWLRNSVGLLRCYFR
jgi:hypothetical protein